MNFGEKPKKRITINITSLVDILIVLLLFFMLTTQFIRMEILHLSLSGKGKADSASADKVDNNKPVITVTLVGGGKFILDGNEFNLLQLKDKMKPLLKDSPGNPIMILSKNKAEVQDVVSAMDYIKSIGGNNISIEEDSADAGE